MYFRDFLEYNDYYMGRMIKNIGHKPSTSTLWIVVVFVFLLATMRCWIGFGGRKQLMIYAFPVLMCILYMLGQVKYVFKARYIIFCSIMAVVALLTLKTEQNINGLIYQIWPALSILFVLCIPDEEKEYVFSKIIEWFGILMVFSIPLYLITMIISLPSLGTIEADYGSGIIAGIYTNYFFYIAPPQLAGISLRFNGPFIEPGDLGCVAAFMLMAARFDFKRYKYLWAVLAGLILSFSLAGYMLVLFAYSAKSLYENKAKTRLLLIGFVVVLAVYLFGVFYNGGDNVINETILSRLESDKDRGILGNNRTSLLKLDYFYAMFSNPQTMWFGYDQATIDRLFEYDLGAGFVNKAIVVGMAGIIGIILPFFYFSFTSSSRKYAMLFFVFFLLYFFQRAETTWIAYVMSYVFGIVIQERDKAIA